VLTCAHTHTHTRTHTHTHTLYTYLCTLSHTQTQTQTQNLYTHIFYTHTCTRTHTHTHARTHTHTHTHTYSIHISYMKYTNIQTILKKNQETPVPAFLTVTYVRNDGCSIPMCAVTPTKIQTSILLGSVPITPPVKRQWLNHIVVRHLHVCCDAFTCV